MSLTNAYTTDAMLCAALNIPDSGDYLMMEAAINAASRQIDAHCGRRFWQDTSVVARSYYPASGTEVAVDDISTTTGLVVKVDTDDDGTFETTLTIGVDFQVEPVNAAALYPVEPYTALRAVGTTYSFSSSGYGRPTVQVTAKFGWAAVPDDVALACLLQARQLFKAPDATFGAFGLAEGAPMRILPLDRVAEGLLVRYRRVEC